MDDDSVTSSSSASSSVLSFCPQSFNEKIKEQRYKSAQEISQLAQDATDIFDKYCDENCNDINEEPDRVFDEIAAVTVKMEESQKGYHEQIASIERERARYHERNEPRFREAYMTLITDAFSDELDDLRHGRIRNNGRDKKEAVADILQQDNIVMPEEGGTNSGHIDIDVLVDMLESGMQDWSSEEKELLLIDLKVKAENENETNMDVDTLTVHERRRRDIFADFTEE